MAFVERVFSGVQPTGNLHLGNYLGAIVNFVKLQDTHNCIYCVVDMHAITQGVDVWGGPAELARSTREVTAAFIAAGIDPKKHIVFNQSQVAGHAELAWIFNCVARIGWLNRMTQFKEKAGKDRENASVGLYDYPVLMAADILVYRATHVPVGEDQRQHVELTLLRQLGPVPNVYCNFACSQGCVDLITFWRPGNPQGAGRMGNFAQDFAIRISDVDLSVCEKCDEFSVGRSGHILRALTLQLHGCAEQFDLL